MYVVHSYGDPGATQGGHSGDPRATHKQQVSSPKKFQPCLCFFIHNDEDDGTSG